MMSFSVNTLSTLNRAHSASMDSIRKIATGSQHPSASYGPAAYAITQRMYSNIGAIHQANSNTQTSNALLSTAAGAANNTVSSLTTLRETLINAANGTNNGSDLSTLQKSVDQTISQINENAGVSFNGKNLLDGSHSAIAVVGTNGYQNVNLGNLTSTALGLTDSQGNSTINLTDTASISDALDKVDNALSMATSQQSSLEGALDVATTIGAQQQGLDFQSMNYTTMEENLTAAASTMDDTDIAAEVTKLKSSQAQEQLALYATKMSMDMQTRMSALSLLR